MGLLLLPFQIVFGVIALALWIVWWLLGLACQIILGAITICVIAIIATGKGIYHLFKWLFKHMKKLWELPLLILVCLVLWIFENKFMNRLYNGVRNTFKSIRKYW